MGLAGESVQKMIGTRVLEPLRGLSYKEAVVVGKGRGARAVCVI